MTFTKAMPLSYWTKEELLYRIEQWGKDNGFAMPKGLKDLRRDDLRKMFLIEDGLTGVVHGKNLIYVGTTKAYRLDSTKLRAKLPLSSNHVTTSPSNRGAVYLRNTPTKRVKKRSDAPKQPTTGKRASESKKPREPQAQKAPRPYSADIAAKLLKSKFGDKVKRLK